MAVVSTASSFEQRRVFESTEMKPQTKSLGREYVYIYLKKKKVYTWTINRTESGIKRTCFVLCNMIQAAEDVRECGTLGPETGSQSLHRNYKGVFRLKKK